MVSWLAQPAVFPVLEALTFECAWGVHDLNAAFLSIRERLNMALNITTTASFQRCALAFHITPPFKAVRAALSNNDPQGTIELPALLTKEEIKTLPVRRSSLKFKIPRKAVITIKRVCKAWFAKAVGGRSPEMWLPARTQYVWRQRKRPFLRRMALRIQGSERPPSCCARSLAPFETRFRKIARRNYAIHREFSSNERLFAVSLEQEGRWRVSMMAEIERGIVAAFWGGQVWSRVLVMTYI